MRTREPSDNDVSNTIQTQLTIVSHNLTFDRSEHILTYREERE